MSEQYYKYVYTVAVEVWADPSDLPSDVNSVDELAASYLAQGEFDQYELVTIEKE